MNPLRPLAPLVLASLVLLPAAAWAAGKAHQHGVLALDIAIEARRVSLQVASPLDNLVGFERAPRNDAERKRVDAALAKLRDATAVFTIDPAAGCKLATVELSSSVLKLGAAGPASAKPGNAKDSEHADLEATYEFECPDAARAAFVDVLLFDAFAGMKQIDVQVATGTAQLKRSLKRPARRVVLTR